MRESTLSVSHGFKWPVLVFGVVLALLLGGIQPTNAAPAHAEEERGFEETLQLDDPTLLDEPQLALDGEIVVVVFDEVGSSRTEYWVVTDAGTVLVEGELDGVLTGSRFVGTVALPDVVTDRLGSALDERVQRSADDPITHESYEGTRLIERADALQQTLPIVSASIELAATQLWTTAHTVDVAILSNGGNSFNLAQATSLVADVSEYWVGQSSNFVAGISINDHRIFHSTALSGCNPESIWNEAAGKFASGRTQGFYSAHASRHLVVIAEAAGCGVGVASVGTGGGGVVYMDADGNTDLHILAHEFGHNLSLGHSNVHECESATLVEGTSAQGCFDFEYDDLYDVMGLAFDYVGVGTTNELTALNVSHKASLGVLSSVDLPTVTAGTQTIDLRPASDNTGIRGVRVVDPVTLQAYFIEYRSGTGMDADGFYTKTFPQSNPPDPLLESLRVGVRILKQRGGDPGRASAVLAQLPDETDRVKMLALEAGDRFFTPSAGLRVFVNSMSASGANLTIMRGLPDTDRIEGASRYTTAIEISKQAYPSPGGAPVAYVAFGGNYPDALGAAPAAVMEGGPLLLTEGHRLTPEVQVELERLAPGKIVVVGGPGVVTPAVFNALKAIQPNTVRLGGGNRYETSRMVVDYAFDSASVAYLATGVDFPDALAASSAGGAVAAPVVLVDGKAGTVDTATIALLNSLGVTEVRLAGGSAVVSTGIANALATAGFTVKRAAGTNRYDTNIKINDVIFTTAPVIYLATGRQFPDALAGAAIAGAQGAPLYLSEQNCIPGEILTSILLNQTETVYLLGGPGALSARVAQLKTC